jgi:hypothetical protein
MKLIVYGHKGWIGKQFIELLQNEKEKYTLGQARVDDTTSLLNELDKVNPTHVISFIGSAIAFMTILEKGKMGEIYNIGCDEGMEYSILDVSKILIKKIKGTDYYKEWITFIEE